MKFLHTGDLHIGKTLNEFDLLKDQEVVLNQIFETAIKEKVNGVIIAGDLYDRSVPPAQAVTLVDEFVTKLVDKNINIFCIGGNHDSPERISFANGILQKKGFFIDSQIGDSLKKIELEDEFGRINIYMLPFLREPKLKEYCKKHFDEDVRNTDEAIGAILSHEKINHDERNILIAHYFVTDQGRIEGYDGKIAQIEEKELGGLGDVDAGRFADFDYVALGHIHGHMRIGSNFVYYSGSPIKYSLREYKQKKGYIVFEMKEKAADPIKTFYPIKPLRDLRKIEGKLEDLLSEEEINKGNRNDYIDAVLLDEKEVYDAIGKLRAVYPYVMHLEYKKDREENLEFKSLNESLAVKSPVDVFKSFVEYVTDGPADEDSIEIVNEIIEEM